MLKVALLLVVSMLSLAPVAVRAGNVCADTFATEEVIQAEEKIQLYSSLFEHYISERIKNLKPRDQELIREVLGRVYSQRAFNTAAYDQLGRSIVVDARITRDMLSYYDLLAHEIEHAIQVVGKPRAALVLGHLTRVLLPTPAITKYVVRSEAEAMGAEWDFLNSIPLHARKQAVNDLKLSLALRGEFKTLLQESISKAELSREQYILESALLAKYTYEHQLWREYAVKISAYALLALTAQQYLSDNGDDSKTMSEECSVSPLSMTPYCPQKTTAGSSE